MRGQNRKADNAKRRIRLLALSPHRIRCPWILAQAMPARTWKVLLPLRPPKAGGVSRQHNDTFAEVVLSADGQ